MTKQNKSRKEQSYSVAIEKTKPEYPDFPYATNDISEAVTEVLKSIGLSGRRNKCFEKILFDHAKVVIKPNFVSHRNIGGFDFESLVTHSSVIKAVIDLLIKSNPTISIIILDIPLQSADWDTLIEKSRIKEIVDIYKKANIEIQLIDARKERVIADQYGTVLKRYDYNGDPKGYATVQLGSESELTEISDKFERFSVTDYKPDAMRFHHNNKKHEYLISKTVLESDLFINIPKLKCHRKGGITISLKNIIGINGSKDWLPHHRRGSLEEGGDEYPYNQIRQKIFSQTIDFVRTKTPRVYKYLAGAYYLLIGKPDLTKLEFNNNSIKEGSWYGNDTLWRTILDLNKIIIYADKNGVLKKTPQRKYLSIVDGVIGMEREGPLAGTSKKAGVILAGLDAASVDIVAARLMGFDENKISQLRNLTKITRKIGASAIDEINIISSNKKWQLLKTNPKKVSLNFIPSAGWKGHIELE